MTNSLDLRNVFRANVGRGLPISVEQLADAARAEEHDVYRWMTDRPDRTEPKASELANILASTVLPATFRKQVDDAIHRRCIDLRAVFVDTGKSSSRPLLRIATEIDLTLCHLEEAIHEITGPASRGGELITPDEGEKIDPRVAKVDALLMELKQAVNAKRCRVAETA